MTDTKRTAWTALAVTVVAFTLASLVDTWAFHNIRMQGVYEKDWGRLLRVMGFMGTWAALALAVGLHDAGATADRKPAHPRRRAWLLLWSPALAGGIAELLKIITRRERPGLHDGLYGWRPWSERTFSGAGLALPSSHAAVAFGGAAMLAVLFPRTRWVGYVLAAGCALTRVLAGAHFVSDVTLAAAIGWATAAVLNRRWKGDG